MKKKIDRIDLSKEQIEGALGQAKAALPADVFHILELVVQAYLNLLSLVEAGRTTIKRLQRMLLGPTSEKSETVLAGGKRLTKGNDPKAKRPALPPAGHGRNGEAAFWGAQVVQVVHQKLKPGDRCPGCGKGKVYDQKGQPGILVRVVGQAPLEATIYHLQKVRCNLCGEIFQAKSPPGVGKHKYDATSASMIGALKYGSGLPFNRLDKLQKSMGIPLPATTQWEIVRDAAKKMQPAYEELVRQAAQGEVLHNDDTTMKILTHMNNTPRQEPQNKSQRTGTFTSGIVSKVAKHLIALFFTGARHAGENLKAVLEQRRSKLGRPIQMCDALSRNLPKPLKTILANCLAHGRRKFVDVVANFPRECEHVLNVLKSVYKNDEIAKKRGMTAVERLRFHQKKSGPLMEKLKSWMEEQIRQKKVEENSGLGKAIGYMLDHWVPLTLFLRQPGAPLDNNVVERSLKKAILHRKNSLFYKTDNGAHVGDLYMTLIHTCELNGVDPFDYLTQLQQHAKEARANPSRWMPWNYPTARAPD